ncbi:MAG: hypothetical protein ACJ741_09490 [Pyrinomonadaceae bacterium]
MKAPRKAINACTFLLCSQILLAPVRAQQKAESKQSTISPQIQLSARATELAVSIGQEASSLTSPVESIQIQLEATRLLAREHPQEALRVLNLALKEVRDCPDSWKSKEKQSKSFQLLSLRGDILSLYTKIDRQQADKLLKALPDCSAKADDSQKNEHADNPVNWDARHRADELVKVGMIKLGQNPAEGISMILSSDSSTGKVSGEISEAVSKLRAAGSDSVVNEIEDKLVEIVSSQTSSDAFNQEAVTTLIAVDPRMSPAVRQALISYLLRGLEGFVTAIKESKVSGQPLQVDYDNLGYLYGEYLREIRRVIEKCAPDRLEYVDAALQQIAAVLPEEWLDAASRMPLRLTPEQASRELERTLEIKDTERRDSRLANFSLRALAGFYTKERRLDLAASALDAIHDSELKAIIRDYYLMTEIRIKVEEENGASAIEKAGMVSNPLWRAWTLMAVGYALTKQPGDTVQLYESAAQTLEKCPPTLRRVEVAFKLAELWGERDPLRAFEVLSRAVIYANQIKQPDLSPLFEKYHLPGSYAVIGKLDLQPAIELAGAGELRIGDGVKKVTQLDWTQTEYLSRKIQEVPLRLHFQLKMCEAAL